MARHIRLKPHLSGAEIKGRYDEALKAYKAAEQGQQAEQGLLGQQAERALQPSAKVPTSTELMRWRILWLLAQGQTAKAISVTTGYSAYWIGQIAKQYNAEPKEALTDRRRSSDEEAKRRKALLSLRQQEELRAALAAPPPSGGDWTGRKVAEWMSTRLKRPVSVQRGWEYMQRLKAATPSRPKNLGESSDVEGVRVRQAAGERAMKSPPSIGSRSAAK